MKFAVADILGVDDFWNVDFNFAAAHFHDVPAFSAAIAIRLNFLIGEFSIASTLFDNCITNSPLC